MGRRQPAHVPKTGRPETITFVLCAGRHRSSKLLQPRLLPHSMKQAQLLRQGVEVDPPSISAHQVATRSSIDDGRRANFVKARLRSSRSEWCCAHEDMMLNKMIEYQSDCCLAPPIVTTPETLEARELSGPCRRGLPVLERIRVRLHVYKAGRYSPRYRCYPEDIHPRRRRQKVPL
jgi:hypothetical protein